MGSRRLAGPLTGHIASVLSARREELGMSYDALALASGMSKPVVHGGLRGTQSIAVEAYVAICAALGVDAGRLLDEAAVVAFPLTQADSLARAADHPDRDETSGGL